MDTFRWVSIVVSMLLGIGVTRLLAAAVDVFKARRHCRIDPLSAFWAALIFLQMVAFWWSLEELSLLVTRWAFHDFLALVALALMLFLAAALVLPQAPAAPGHFALDGRYALLALAAFNGAAIAVNIAFWKAEPFSTTTALNAAAAGTPFVAFFLPRAGQAAAAAIYAALLGAGLALLTPAAY